MELIQEKAKNIIARAKDEGWKNILIISTEPLQIPEKIFHLTNLHILHLEYIRPDTRVFPFTADESLYSGNASVSRALRLLKKQPILGSAYTSIFVMGLPFFTDQGNVICDVDISRVKIKRKSFTNTTGDDINLLLSEIDKLDFLTEIRVISISPIKLLKQIDELSELKLLRILTLISLEIERLPSDIGELDMLKILKLSGNQLTKLPIEIQKLQSLKEFDLKGNPLGIPPEILKKADDPNAILSAYFGTSPLELLNRIPSIGAAYDEVAYAELSSSLLRHPLLEAKIPIVGQGSVGKTSLVKRILTNAFDVNETKTEGIAINHWQVNNQSEIENKQSKIKLNIWDFGGQEIMHATHQFFLTKR